MSKNEKLRKEIEVLRMHLANAQAENVILRLKIDAMARKLFGKKSEQLNPDQMQFLLNGLDNEPAGGDETSEDDDGEKEQRKRQKRRPRTGKQAVRTPEDLKVVKNVVIPEWVQANPEQWKEIGREETKRLDYQPAQFFWTVTVRPKFVHRTKRELAPIVAPAPASVGVGGLASAGLLAQLIVNRNCDHMPFHRQQQKFWRENMVWISRQQMCEWTEQSVRLLEGVVAVMGKELRQRRYIQVDETPIRFQDRQRSGICPKGWMWTGLDPGRSVVFHWDTSRGHDALTKLIGKEFQGSIGVDGHSAYATYARKSPKTKLLRCWAHLRRKVFEAKETEPRVAGWILNQIGWLYRWEKEWRANGVDAPTRAVQRDKTSRMVVERLGRAFQRLLIRYRPSHPMGKALGYALADWPRFTAFLDCGEAEIDSNLVENAIRPSALGKKNWLFIGHVNAGQRSAVIYSLTETCRMLGINPYDYLKDLLERLPTAGPNEMEQLTPERWLEAKSATSSKAA